MPRPNIDPDDANFEFIRDRHGRIVHDQYGRPKKILRDMRTGASLRVPMTMLDHDPDLNGLQRAVARNVHRNLHDGRGNPVGHRPGFIVDDRISTADRQRAYDEYSYDLENAWRNPSGAGQHGQIGQMPGDSCTVGVVARGETGELVCRISERADALPRPNKQDAARPTYGGSSSVSGYRRSGWVYENEDPDDDNDGNIEQAVRCASTHHESMQGRDDHMTIDELRKHHTVTPQNLRTPI